MFRIGIRGAFWHLLSGDKIKIYMYIVTNWGYLCGIAKSNLVYYQFSVLVKVVKMLAPQIFGNWKW